MHSSSQARRRSSPIAWRCSRWPSWSPTLRSWPAKASPTSTTAATAFFAVTESFRIGRIEDAVRSIAVTDYYDGLALSRAADMIGSARRGIAVSALSANGQSGDPVATWLEAGGERIARTRERLQALTEGGDLTVSRLSVASGLMSDLTQ